MWTASPITFFQRFTTSACLLPSQHMETNTHPHHPYHLNTEHTQSDRHRHPTETNKAQTDRRTDGHRQILTFSDRQTQTDTDRHIESVRASVRGVNKTGQLNR